MSSALLRRKLRALRPLGGCLHLASTMSHVVNDFGSGIRDNIPTAVMAIIGGDSADDYSGATRLLASGYGGFCVTRVIDANLFDLLFRQAAVFHRSRNTPQKKGRPVVHSPACVRRVCTSAVVDYDVGA